MRYMCVTGHKAHIYWEISCVTSNFFYKELYIHFLKSYRNALILCKNRGKNHCNASNFEVLFFKRLSQYFVLKPLCLTTKANLLGIEAIRLSIVSCCIPSHILYIFFPRSTNCLYVSFVMLFWIASDLILVRTRWKKFSIGFRSGEQAGILTISYPLRVHAFLQPLNFFSDILLGGSCGAVLIHFSHRAKLSPVIFQSWWWHITTPLPWLIATKKLAIFPPLPSFLPFVMMASPLLGFWHVKLDMALASPAGFGLNAKPTPAK